MKKQILIIVVLFTGIISNAQRDGGFGIKGGLNYGSTGDLRENSQTIIDNPDAKLGYNVGVFGKLNFSRFYVRPELSYTKLSNEYQGTSFDVQKLDLPLLLGVQVIGPLHVFAGPSLQYIIDTDYENIRLEDVRDELTVGLQIGAGINLGNIGLDVRYERGLNSNEVQFTNLNETYIDTRPSQIIVGLSLKI